MVKFAASLNMMFDTNPFEDRVEQAAEAGFDGIEVIGWDRNVTTLSELCDRYDITFTYLSGERPPLTDPNRIDAAVESIKESIHLASKVDASKLNVASGSAQPELELETQQKAVIETLHRVAPTAEAADVTIVFEALNSRDSPGQFITTVDEAAAVVSMVDSPSVRLLFDIYHEQISHGDIIRSLRNHANLIEHIQIADNPGRHEPGTGELNYETILAAVQEIGYDGFVGCEFYPTVAPGDALNSIKSFVATE